LHSIDGKLRLRKRELTEVTAGEPEQWTSGLNKGRMALFTPLLVKERPISQSQAGVSE
jgi:hypothetical protein